MSSLFEYTVHRERNFQHHMIMLGTMDGNPVYMDFTSQMNSAISSDERRGYDTPAKGPAQAIEISRAVEYAQFARPLINSENMNKFNTILRDKNGVALKNKKDEPVRGYSFFTDQSNAKPKE